MSAESERPGGGGAQWPMCWPWLGKWGVNGSIRVKNRSIKILYGQVGSEKKRVETKGRE